MGGLRGGLKNPPLRLCASGGRPSSSLVETRLGPLVAIPDESSGSRHAATLHPWTHIFVRWASVMAQGRYLRCAPVMLGISLRSPGNAGVTRRAGIHATRDNSRIVALQAPTPRYRSAVVRGLRPRSPAGLCPAPTRELAHLPVATKGNGIPAHIHVRRVASWFWRVSRLTLIPAP